MRMYANHCSIVGNLPIRIAAIPRPGNNSARYQRVNIKALETHLQISQSAAEHGYSLQVSTVSKPPYSKPRLEIRIARVSHMMRAVPKTAKK